MPRTPFNPRKPEKTLNIEVTGKEAHLIKCLRKLAFGKGIIHKANGVLIRFETTESMILDEDEGLMIED